MHIHTCEYGCYAPEHGRLAYLISLQTGPLGQATFDPQTTKTTTNATIYKNKLSNIIKLTLKFN